MPTVARFHALRVVIYPNDHRPAHVHVIGPDGEAVFFLNCPDGPPQLRECYGFKLKAVKMIGQELERLLASLCQTWKEMHGND